jgi:hypothetical protein
LPGQVFSQHTLSTQAPELQSAFVEQPAPFNRLEEAAPSVRALWPGSAASPVGASMSAGGFALPSERAPLGTMAASANGMRASTVDEGESGAGAFLSLAAPPASTSAGW